MLLINRKSPELLQVSGNGRRADIVRIDDNQLIFTKGFCVSNSLRAGQFIHFLNDGKVWRFFVNDDPDGFPLISNSKQNGGLMVCSRPLVTMLRKALNAGSEVLKFPLQKTSIVAQGRDTFMILTDKPIK